MKLTLEPTEDQTNRSPEARFNAVTIESQDDELTVEQALELFKCALLAWQYSPDNIKQIQIVEAEK